MWVRFWARSSGNAEQEETYRWVSDRETDASLTDYAQELVPAWMQQSDRTIYTGYQILEKLPQEIKDKLWVVWSEKKQDAEDMLTILKKS